MTPESQTPQRVDLSNNEDITKLKDSLTEDEQIKLDEYFSAEKEGIIYLTQEELGELKNALAYENNHHRDRNEIIDEFIDEQIAEEVSISEILGNEENTPFISAFELKARESLFGDESPLKNLDLHKGAQDNFIVSCSLAILEQLQTNPDILRKLVEENYDTETNSFNFDSLDQDSFIGLLGLDENSSLQTFIALTGKTESYGAGSLHGPKLRISDNGETNSIFMNVEEGKAFFLKLMTEQMSEEDIEMYIEERNNHENIPLNAVTALREELTGSVAEIGKNLSRIVEEMKSTGVHTEEIQGDLTPLENGEEADKNWLDKIFEFIEKFFAGIIDFSEDEGLVDDGDTETDTPDPEELAPTTLEAGRKLFREKLSEGNISPFTLSEIQNLFPEDGELSETAQKIIQSIENVPNEGTQDTFEEKFNNLFAAREGKDTSKFQEFIQSSNGTLLIEGKSAGDNILAVMQKFVEYTESEHENYGDFFEASTN